MRNSIVLTLCMAAILSPIASAAIVAVDSAQFFNPVGILAIGGQTFSITASGTAELAMFDGPYQTDPNGVITAAPVPGGGADNYFTLAADPTGVHPAVGNTKSVLIGSFAHLPGSPYGALVAGFSPSASPSGFGDFPDGFQFVGSSGSVVAPAGGGYFFLGINDINNTSDNSGRYLANVTVVPEPTAGSLSLSAVLGLMALCRRARPAHVSMARV